MLLEIDIRLHDGANPVAKYVGHRSEVASGILVGISDLCTADIWFSSAIDANGPLLTFKLIQ